MPQRVPPEAGRIAGGGTRRPTLRVGARQPTLQSISPPAGSLRFFPLARIDQFHEPGSQKAGRPSAMAETGLDLRAQFAERAMVFGDFEERIVAEAARPAGEKRMRPRQQASLSA